MTPGAPGRPASPIQFGLPGGDPLVARIFPALPHEVKWGLERTERMLASLGDPHRAYPVLHVGGTNGKGSVARIWANVLQEAGFRVGLYTSPHLISFRERILIQGSPLPDELLEEWSLDVRPLLVRESPSFFEAATVLGFLAFFRAGVEVAVVEVGMGGRLDATNVVVPTLAAVTNVGLDHTGMLGDSLDLIAREKAGIFKAGVPVFTATDEPEAMAALREEAAQREALLRHVGPPSGNVSADGVQVRISTSRWGTMELSCPLVGRHQMRNLALCVKALEALPPKLPVSREAVEAGVSRTLVPGRFQVEREGRRKWILDVAHNLASIRALANTIEEIDPPRPCVGLVGILADKPWREMTMELDRVLDSIILTKSSWAPPGRAWDPEGSAADLSDGQATLTSSVAAGVDELRASERARTVVVTGSSYTVGECLHHLGRIPQEALPVPFESG